MKRLSSALLLALGLLVLASPLRSPRAEEIPLMEKTGLGAWDETYSGQEFRVTSTASIRLKFEVISPTHVKLTIGSDDGLPGRVSVYWKDFSKFIYAGQIPMALPWEGTLDTEGGFVDR
jgi:hypothetical protein